MTFWRRLLTLASLAALVPDAPQAQSRGANERLHDISVDVGGLALRRTDDVWRPAVSVVPHWRAATRDGALYLGGAVSGTQEGYESAYGTLGLELTPRSASARPWDLAGSATVLSAREAEAIGVATLRGRKHWMSQDQGAWVGVTVGGRTQDQTQFASIAAEASMWRSVAPTTTLLVSASAINAGDFMYYYAHADAPQAEFRVPHTARFGELAGAVRHADRRLEMSLDGRYRIGPAAVLGGSTAFTGDVAYWLTSRYAVVGMIGRHLADPALGTASTVYASISLRIAARSVAAQSHGSMPREPLPSRRPDVMHARDTRVVVGAGAVLREVELSAVHDGAQIVLRVAGETVEVAGDFSDWQPVTLVGRSGAWTLPQALAAGVYRFVIRVDGGDWRPANGLPRMRDDFGGEVGVVTIR
jgi:hypothetical protein